MKAIFVTTLGVVLPDAGASARSWDLARAPARALAPGRVDCFGRVGCVGCVGCSRGGAR